MDLRKVSFQKCNLKGCILAAAKLPAGLLEEARKGEAILE